MKISNVEAQWRLTPKQAVALQQRLRKQVILRDQVGEVHTVAGTDVGFADNGKTVVAAVAVLDFPSLSLREVATARQACRFPYVPGLLSFRELPAVLAALEKLARAPDLVLCDGQGYAHPRRFGIACHLGVITGLPTIGVAKTRLLGEHPPLPDRRGAWVPLRDGGETIGAVLRSRQGVKPIYVSAGHKVSLARALDYVMACTTRFKLPETTRWAHRHASGLV